MRIITLASNSCYLQLLIDNIVLYVFCLCLCCCLQNCCWSPSAFVAIAPLRLFHHTLSNLFFFSCLIAHFPIILIELESQLVRLSYTHWPCLLVPALAVYKMPTPCLVSFSHYPMYLLPLGKIMVPFPSFLPALKSPSQRRPSLQVNLPLPSNRFWEKFPSYVRSDSAKQQTPYPWKTLSTKSPSQKLPSAHSQRPRPFFLPWKYSPSNLIFPCSQVSCPKPC